MSSVSFVTYVTDPLDVTHSRITDLDIVTIGGVAYLYSGTRYDGVLRQWSIADGGLTISADFAYQDGDLPGGVAGMTLLEGTSSPLLLTGGTTFGQLQTINLNPDGSLGATVAFNTMPEVFAGFQNGEDLAFAEGGGFLFGTLAGQSGLARIDYSASGTISNPTVLTGPNAQPDHITAVATVIIGTQGFVVTASDTQNAVTIRSVAEDGSILGLHTIGASDGLWISAPTALKVATVGEGTYAILGSAGTDSLSIIAINPDGSLIVRDHVLDARETRFGGVTSLDVVQVQQHTYVIAGGADDGISIFQLLEGGLLVHLAAFEDTDDIGLDNISALVSQTSDSGLDIFVASSSEPGITQLRFDTGQVGITATATLAGGRLDGTNGSDVLQGHNGDDVILAAAGNDLLRDGAGTDILSGGAGADIFILSADGETDTITDFEVGEDKIDLSLWPMLRDISQLFITIEETGMRITYGTETLSVHSAESTPIDYRDLSTTDLIGLSRLSADVEPGYPGPATPTSYPDGPPPPPLLDQGDENSVLTPILTLVSGNADLVREGLLADDGPAGPGLVINGSDMSEFLSGSDEPDLVMAGSGADTVFGLGGDDTIFGRAGNDILEGGDGADTVLGGDGDDDIAGGNGHDYLAGGAGADHLNGHAGDDILIGEGGADTFVFTSGHDQIVDFEQGVDSVVLDPGLWTGLTSAADLLFIYGSFEDTTATIDFENGNILTIDGITDQDALFSDIFLF